MGGRRRSLLGLALVLAATVVAHGGALDNAFHYDDLHSILDNRHIRRLTSPAAFFTDPQTYSARPERAMFRPLVALSCALNYAAGGSDPRGYLAVNLAAHGVCALLVWLLGAGLGLAPSARTAAALLFAVHPANAEVVNYVSSRSESFAAAGLLGALAAWTAWRRGGGATRYGAGLAALAGGLLSKSTAVVVPAMVAAYEGLGRPPRRWAAAAPFAALSCAYAVVVAGAVGAAVGTPVRPLAAQAWTQVKALPYYAHLLVLPVHLTVEHDFAVSGGPDPAVLLGGAFALSLAGLAWHRLQWRGRALAAWGALSLVPASAVPLNVLVNEHRLYVATACLGLLLCGGLAAGRGAVGWRRPAAVALGLGAVALGVLSQGRSRVWDTELALWSEAVARSPHAYRAHLHLGGAREAAGDLPGALASYRTAAALAPQVAEAHYNLGNALRLAGRAEEARREYERSLELEPAFLDALINLAALHQDAGQLPAARRLLERARGVAPRAAEVWRRLGVLARAAGDGEGAREAYGRALELDPDNGETWYNLANLVAASGRSETAAQLYGRALAADPGHVGAAANLALAALESGEPAAAARVCADALRLSPGQSKLFYLLGQAQEAQGLAAAALTSYRAAVAGTGTADVLDAARQRIAQLEADLR